MQSTVESVEGNKVKLHITVPADEFERAIDAAFRKLAREVRVPGFRPGKAPRRLLEARLGTDIAREHVLREPLPEFYVDAVTEHEVDVIVPPEIEITAGQDEGDVEFEAVVEVRPQVHLMGYDELRVELPIEPVREKDVDDQVDRLRDRFADLTDSDLPLIDDAYATIDIAGSIDGKSVEGLTATDFLYRVGSAMVVPELDNQLRGTRPGAILEFTAELPERFGDRAGEQATFRIMVKEAKQKVLPQVTNEWVDEASEFDTVSELRDDLRRRLETVQRLQARMATRDKVLEAVAELVPIPAPEALVDTETRRRVEDLAHRLSHENATLEDYLQAIDQEPEAFLDGVREGSARAVLADLALRAVVTQEAISVSKDEVGAEVERIANQLEQKVEKVRRDLERRGVLETVRSDLARGKALEFLIDHATVVDEEGNVIDLTIPDGRPSGDTTDENESSADESTEDESTKERPEGVTEPMRSQYVPMPRFIQDTPRGRMEWDPYSRLANDRIIFMGTPVDDTVANLIIAQLLILESEDPDKDVVMYINSPGGEITGLFAIYDTMQYIKPDVQTICIGQAASAAAVLLASGAPGKRFILPHARVLIHQPHGGASGQAVDIEIQAREITRMRELLDEILAFHTGQPVERVKKDTDRDFIMSAIDAADYGLVDEVITNRELAAVPSAESTN